MRAPLAAWLAAVITAGVGGTASAWAAGLGLSSQRVTVASPVATPAFYPSALAATNVGKTVGLAESKDTVSVAFSAAPSPGTLCPGTWGTKTPNLNATVTINDNAGTTGDDTLTVGAVGGGKCGTGFVFGAVDLGAAGYVTSGSVSFPTSTISLTSPTTLTITLSAPSKPGPSPSRVTSGSPAVYYPAPTIADGAGATIGSNTVTTTTSIQF